MILNFGTGVQVGEVGGKFKLLTDKKRNGLGHSCDLSLKLEPSESNPPCSSRFLSAECSPAAAAVAAATPSPSAEDPLPDWTDDLLPTMLPCIVPAAHMLSCNKKDCNILVLYTTSLGKIIGVSRDSFLV